MVSDSFDVGVIGGGIVGLATARAVLQRRRCSLVVLEAEERIARHQTGHSSGVIHSGLYYRPGSLKAKLCTEGSAALLAFCREHSVPFEICGKLVVAVADREVAALEELERRGKAHGLAGIERLGAGEISRFEPHVRGVAALRVPQTGIVDFTRVAAALAAEVESLGGVIRTLEGVRRIGAGPSVLELETPASRYRVARLFNCAGLHSDRVACLAGLDPGVKIVPFRGEYYELCDSARDLVRDLVYPVPDARFPFLGVHFTRRIDGRMEAGPNAVLSLSRTGYRRGSLSFADSFETLTYGGFWRLAWRYWRAGLGEELRSHSKRAFVHALRRLVPDLSPADVVPGGAGIRAQALAGDGRLLDDFHIVKTANMVHVLNAPSPAATASLAIGAYVAAQ
jgi:L-2-hydroxyglutarate oxidase LhgO